MTNDKPAREFWIRQKQDGAWQVHGPGVWLENLDTEKHGFTRTIEHSAYQALKLENESLKKELKDLNDAAKT